VIFVLVGFQMRNSFRERLVMGLRKRVYHGKKPSVRAYWDVRPGGKRSRP